MGGSDDPSNIEIITIEEHIQRHRDLYESFGKWEDDLAVRFLSGIISKKEAVLESLKMGGKIVGIRRKSEIHKKRIGLSKIGVSRVFSEEWKRNIGDSVRGIQRTDEWRKNLSLSTRGIPKKKYPCSCGKMVDAANHKRWHSTHEIFKNG